MTTLRRDVTSNEWVILAPRRADRPHAPKSVSRPSQPPFDPACPFCPGNEHLTPPEVARVPGGDGWHLRVVPNLFPVLDGHAERIPREIRTVPGDGDEILGVGAHEVVIEGPRHDGRFDEVTGPEGAAIVRLWQERYRALAGRPEVRFVQVFKNFGPTAGTSLPHTHSQIIATPLIPPEPARQFRAAVGHWRRTGRSSYQDVVDFEVGSGLRVVARREGAVAFCPFAGRSPLETWIVPGRHEASFARARQEEVEASSELLALVLRGLRVGGGDPDFNVVLASAPPEEDHPGFRWHLRVLPRMAIAAGFELGSGMFINPTSPEDGAAALREGAGE